MRSVVSVLLLSFVGAGCADSLGPGMLSGKWAEDLSRVESRWEIDLSVTGPTTVVGTGSWYGEACCDGSLSATGTVKGMAVHLDILSTVQHGARVGSTDVSHFDGTLITAKVLHGTVTYDSPGQTPTSVIYYRQ